MIGKFILRIMALVLTLICAPRAHAFVRTVTEKTSMPMHWNTSCIPFLVRLNSAPDGVDPNLFMNAATAGAAAWSHALLDCSALSLDLAGCSSAEVTATANDGVNNVIFRSTDWTHDGLILALTSVWARDRDGEIVDTDIEINAATFQWTALDVHAELAHADQDMQNALTHEFGHVIGLAHTCAPESVAVRPLDNNGQPIAICGDNAPLDVLLTTMYPAVKAGDLERRTLKADDKNGVCTIYPSTVPLACKNSAPKCSGQPSPSSGGCTVAASAPQNGGRKNAPWLLLLPAAALFAAGRFGRSVLRKPPVYGGDK